MVKNMKIAKKAELVMRKLKKYEPMKKLNDSVRNFSRRFAIPFYDDVTFELDSC